MTDDAADSVHSDQRLGVGPTLAIAHRGEPVLNRENTVPAVRAGVAAGADVIEIDVKTTADGVCVLLHDDTLRRLWGDDRAIAEMTVEQIDAVGTPDMRIPKLTDVLPLVGGTSCALMVDMDAPEWAPAALQVVQDAVALGVVRSNQIVWCGHRNALRTVREADPDARILLSWGEEFRTGFPDDDVVAQLRPEAFNPHWSAVGPVVRDWARERGLALSCWTVDDRDDLRRLLATGVDAVISNQVSQLVQEVREWNAQRPAGAGARTA